MTYFKALIGMNKRRLTLAKKLEHNRIDLIGDFQYVGRLKTSCSDCNSHSTCSRFTDGFRVIDLCSGCLEATVLTQVIQEALWDEAGEILKQAQVKTERLQEIWTLAAPLISWEHFLSLAKFGKYGYSAYFITKGSNLDKEKKETKEC